VTDPAWVPGDLSSPSNDRVPQASPTTSEANEPANSIDGVEEAASYDRCSSYMTLENEG
jgi:hypothetical protein